MPPPLKDELVIDRLSALQVKPSYEALRKEAADLDAQIRQIQDALDTLFRIQQRSLEASLYNKANEVQEDISMKRFDLRVAQIHLSAINSQVRLLLYLLFAGSSNVLVNKAQDPINNNLLESIQLMLIYSVVRTRNSKRLLLKPFERRSMDSDKH